MKYGIHLLSSCLQQLLREIDIDKNEASSDDDTDDSQEFVDETNLKSEIEVILNKERGNNTQ